MDSRKDNSNTRVTREKKGIFMRLIDWIAKGAEKAQKGSGQCPT